MPSEYLLFLDTETTGLPTRWDRPYSELQHWPRVVQLAWLVYDAAGKLIKTDQDYLQIPPDTMPASAVAIHGLTPEFLRAKGRPPVVVLRRLLRDLKTYRPRIVGHFLRLDFHVLGAALAQAGLANPLAELPQFCTMQLRLALPGSAPHRYLRLPELHKALFGTEPVQAHDAYADAAATARCFFELQQRGLLPVEVLNGQRPLLLPGTRRWWLALWWVLPAAALIVVLFLSWLLYG
jgi:DNA polymerase-3 subunit epsilon